MEESVPQDHGPVSCSHGKVLCGTLWSLPLGRAALTGAPGLDGHPHSMPSLAHSVFCFSTSISEQVALPSCLASTVPPAWENPKERLSDIVNITPSHSVYSPFWGPQSLQRHSSTESLPFSLSMTFLFLFLLSRCVDAISSKLPSNLLIPPLSMSSVHCLYFSFPETRLNLSFCLSLLVVSYSFAIFPIPSFCFLNHLIYHCSVYGPIIVMCEFLRLSISGFQMVAIFSFRGHFEVP